MHIRFQLCSSWTDSVEHLFPTDRSPEAQTRLCQQSQNPDVQPVQKLDYLLQKKGHSRKGRLKETSDTYIVPCFRREQKPTGPSQIALSLMFNNSSCFICVDMRFWTIRTVWPCLAMSGHSCNNMQYWNFGSIAPSLHGTENASSSDVCWKVLAPNLWSIKSSLKLDNTWQHMQHHGTTFKFGVPDTLRFCPFVLCKRLKLPNSPLWSSQVQPDLDPASVQRHTPDLTSETALQYSEMVYVYCILHASTRLCQITTKKHKDLNLIILPSTTCRKDLWPSLFVNILCEHPHLTTKKVREIYRWHPVAKWQSQELERTCEPWNRKVQPSNACLSGLASTDTWTLPVTVSQWRQHAKWYNIHRHSNKLSLAFGWHISSLIPWLCERSWRFLGRRATTHESG